MTKQNKLQRLACGHVENRTGEAHSRMHEAEVTSGRQQCLRWTPRLSTDTVTRPWIQQRISHHSEIWVCFARAYGAHTCGLEALLCPSQTLCCCLSNEISLLNTSTVLVDGSFVWWDTFSISPFPHYIHNPCFLKACHSQPMVVFVVQHTKRWKLAKEMSLWLGSNTLRRTLISFSFW